MLDFLTVGTIINVHGVVGEVKVSPTTDDLKRFKKLKRVFLCPPENAVKGERREMKVTSAKLLNRFAVIKFEGIDDRDTANTLRGYDIEVSREDAVKLPEDTYFIGDLIGCTVFEEDGNVLGKIDDVFTAGGSDVYSITDEAGHNMMLPALGEVVLCVDVENRKVTVRLLPGLKEVYFE